MVPVKGRWESPETPTFITAVGVGGGWVTFTAVGAGGGWVTFTAVGAGDG